MSDKAKVWLLRISIAACIIAALRISDQTDMGWWGLFLPVALVGIAWGLYDQLRALHKGLSS